MKYNKKIRYYNQDGHICWSDDCSEFMTREKYLNKFDNGHITTCPDIKTLKQLTGCNLQVDKEQVFKRHISNCEKFLEISRFEIQALKCGLSNYKGFNENKFGNIAITETQFIATNAHLCVGIDHGYNLQNEGIKSFNFDYKILPFLVNGCHISFDNNFIEIVTDDLVIVTKPVEMQVIKAIQTGKILEFPNDYWELVDLKLKKLTKKSTPDFAITFVTKKSSLTKIYDDNLELIGQGNIEGFTPNSELDLIFSLNYNYVMEIMRLNPTKLIIPKNSKNGFRLILFEIENGLVVVSPLHTDKTNFGKVNKLSNCKNFDVA